MDLLVECELLSPRDSLGIFPNVFPFKSFTLVLQTLLLLLLAWEVKNFHKAA